MTSPSPRFTDFLPFILKWECDWPADQSGQFSLDPDDPGGATKFGIDLRSARQDHPAWTEAEIRALTVEAATEIYWRDYWLRHGIEALPIKVGEVFFNAKQNGGHPDEWLKQCQNSAAKFVDFQEKYYHDLCACWARKGKHDPYKFLPGWLNRTRDLRRFLSLPPAS